MNKLDKSLLNSLSSFRRLEDDQLREVLDLARLRRVPTGKPIFEEAEDAKQFFLLLDGHVRVERLNAEGDKVISLHIPPGQLFGIARALGRDTYPASAMAAVECIVLIWPMSLWDDFAGRYEGFAAEAYKTVGQRVSEMNNQIMELATQHVEQRVARAVLRLMKQHGRNTDSGVQIAFPVTRKIISEMTGSTLHTVSRLLSRWERQRILRSAHRHIHVLDASRLEELTRQDA
ncbi:cAMP-binding domain of CRP or a regulatory subunit of cAMP-dependent protein kinases [Shimia gijangensis]|uniref:cAMP-binding domain of CRP or a regulatory subunit of cAMP-dependent protein kinases n=1 Tax=Shimia gijangensis TaxID=1470563 RepID=A0A1M6JV49_9RHOB|nr:Crp/Fnr family transcriptional regulator [Shimia gijangensis]SHJ50563.1 cAMP-binding domain of CRP or a regulatory subunit of cAMP-dependent protein kinases [Shimia gijangensis]